jgi:hypothetical protein
MQDQEFSADARMNPDTMVEELGGVLSMYKVPVGLINKVRPLPYHAFFMVECSNRLLLL